MLKYADTLADGSELRGDICIIGTGAAGLVMAERFIRSGFRNVIVLESSRVSVPVPQSNEKTEELVRQGTVLNADNHRYQDPAVQPMYDGVVTRPMAGIDPRFLTRSRIRVYGGTTNCWGGWTVPLANADFDHRELSPNSFWPIRRDALKHYYSEAVRYCSLPAEIAVDPWVYDDARWWEGKTVQPIEAIRHTSSSMVRSVAFTVIGGNGQQDEKWDFQKKLGPAIEAAQNVTIWRNANAKRLVVSGGGVTRVEAQTVDVVNGVPTPGKVRFTVAAPRFVLAAGGVETVRLLLLSGSPGSGSALLGRTFMVHPVIWGLGRFQGGKRPSEAVSRFYSQQPELRIDPTLPRALVFAAMTPTDATLSRYPIGNFRAIVNFGGSGGGSIGMNWEQAPDPASTIRLDPNQKDVLGSPVVSLDWKLPQRDLDTARIGADMVAQELKALGYASDYYVPSPTTIDTPGDHPMGGTRMADSPGGGYVDADCRVHGVPNLYIASSSVFPTGGYANPTLTIIALAARLADHLMSPSA